MDDLIRGLAEAVICGWPAGEIAELDGWLLREWAYDARTSPPAARGGV
jgi:hypothetical protein